MGTTPWVSSEPSSDAAVITARRQGWDASGPIRLGLLAFGLVVGVVGYVDATARDVPPELGVIFLTGYSWGYLIGGAPLPGMRARTVGSGPS
jgi:hypothetical protein